MNDNFFNSLQKSPTILESIPNLIYVKLIPNFTKKIMKIFKFFSNKIDLKHISLFWMEVDRYYQFKKIVKL